jgi:hypothetical protein
VLWSEGASPFILWVRGGGLGFFFQIVFDVESGLSTIHFPLGQSSLHASFFFFLNIRGEGQRGGVKTKSSQVPDMFFKEFSIAPHFYLICQYKCCLPFTYINEPNGSNFIFQNRIFFFGELP